MKKRAFTLTELLVVVVIIGVLSAVVLPKFTKILQTRKTTEAENVMAAVRNEQEARCMVGRDYTADTAKLASLPKAKSQNYTYNLEATGITATAKDGSYSLKIPSYTDGRICCSGEGCNHLNKDYLVCGSITDLVEASCEAPEGCKQEDKPQETSEACECGGMKYTHYECVGNTWTAYEDNQCNACDEKEYCEPGKPGWDKWSETAQNCEQGHGDNKYTGTWNTQKCGCDCPNGTSFDVQEGCICKAEGGHSWSGDAQDCETGHGGAAIVGTWNEVACACDCPKGSHWEDGGCVSECNMELTENQIKMQSCEDPQTTQNFYPKGGEWDSSKCTCKCPDGYKLDENLGVCVPDCKGDYWYSKREYCLHGPYGLEGAVPGYFGNFGDPEGCSCRCPYWNGAQLKDGYCYRPTCRSDKFLEEDNTAGWQIRKERCELFGSGYAQCTDGTYVEKTNKYSSCRSVGETRTKYVRGTWNEEKCWCNCPKYSYYFGYIYSQDPQYSGKAEWRCLASSSWGEERDTDQDTDYGIADDWPDNDQENDEDDDYMGTGVYDNTTEDSDEYSEIVTDVDMQNEFGYWGYELIVVGGANADEYWEGVMNDVYGDEDGWYEDGD